jgi:hypothetical protein
MCGRSRDGERTTCATARMPGRFRLWTMVMRRLLRVLIVGLVVALTGDGLLLLLLCKWGSGNVRG